jgi:hypothetical protein
MEWSWVSFADTIAAWERLQFPRPNDLLHEYIIVLRTTFLLRGLSIPAAVMTVTDSSYRAALGSIPG